MTGFKILTLNSHHGVGKDGKYNFDLLCDEIAKLECDVICLQEVDAFALRSRFNNQPKLLAAKLGFNLSKSRVRFFGLGNQYNVILSRFDFVSSFTANLPRVSGTQKRKALLTVINVDGTNVALTNTHLHSHGSKKEANLLAEKQLEYIYKNTSHDTKHVVAGDFNLLPESVEEIASKYEFDAPSVFLTSPANNPKRQIDWITGRNVKVSNVFVTDQLPSDHRGLVATVSI